MLNKRKLLDYIRRIREVSKKMNKTSIIIKEPSDEAKIRLYNLRDKEEILDIDYELSWFEYLCEVEYTFNDMQKDKTYVRTTHYIVRGHTSLDVDAFLDTLIYMDLEEFRECLPEYDVTYEVVSIVRIKFN